MLFRSGMEDIYANYMLDGMGNIIAAFVFLFIGIAFQAKKGKKLEK